MFGAILVGPQVRTFIEESLHSTPQPPLQASISSQHGEVIAPNYVSSDTQGQQFALKAQSAHNATNDTIVFNTVSAELTPHDQTTVHLHAPQGIAQQSQNIFTLEGGVSLHQPNHYRMTTPRTEINFRTGQISGKDKIIGQMPFGDIEGQEFVIDPQEKHFRVMGKAKITLTDTTIVKPVNRQSINANQQEARTPQRNH